MRALRQFGLDLQRTLIRRDREISQTATRAFHGLDVRLTAIAADWLSAMIVNDRLDYALWATWRRSFMNALHRAIKDTYDDLAKHAQVVQKDGFQSAQSAMIGILTTLYPSNVVPTDTVPSVDLDFREPPSSLAFHDHELHALVAQRRTEAVAEGMPLVMATVLTETSFRFWSEYGNFVLPVMEAQPSPITIRVGTGKIAPDWLDFVHRQVDADLEPGKLITTMSADHLKFVQGVLLGAMVKGQTVSWARDKILQHLTTEWETTDPRKGLAYNVLRVLRTSHNRAANAAMTYVAARNPMVVEMERVADGRPCVSCLPPSTLCRVDSGYRVIDEMHVGDLVHTHLGRLRKVTGCFSRYYDGDLVIVKTGAGHRLHVTPEHPILTPEGWMSAELLTTASMVCTDAPIGGRHMQKITVIRRESYQGLVCNLRVEEDESYCAGGVYVHNCMILDGTRYPIGSMLVDHPNGMCLLTPVVKSLEDLGFDSASLPQEAQIAWRRQERPHPPMWMQFDDLPETDQRHILGNAVFDLWKTEQFPLEAFVTKKQGWFVPVSASALRQRLSELGGISYPKVAIGNLATGVRPATATDRALMTLLDPRDRALPDHVLLSGISPDELPILPGAYGQNLLGMGLEGTIPDAVRTQADDWLFSLRGHVSDDLEERGRQMSGVPWQEFNERARTLGLYLRKVRAGSLYWMVPEKDFGKLLRKAAATVEQPTTWQEVVVLQQQALEPLLQEYAAVVKEIEDTVLSDSAKRLAQQRGITTEELGIQQEERWVKAQERVWGYFQKGPHANWHHNRLFAVLDHGEFLSDWDWQARDVERWSTELSSQVREAMRLVSKRLAGRSVFFDETGRPGLRVVHTMSGRAYHHKNVVAVVDLDSPTMFHELGHHLERERAVSDLTTQFLADRTQGEQPVTLRSIYDGHYGEDEKTKKDRFHSAYAGKLYTEGRTEILSMGFQHFIDVRTLVKFWQADPEHFYLIAGILRGQIPGL